jgi:hypothetical protein
MVQDAQKCHLVNYATFLTRKLLGSLVGYLGCGMLCSLSFMIDIKVENNAKLYPNVFNLFLRKCFSFIP